MGNLWTRFRGTVQPEEEPLLISEPQKLILKCSGIFATHGDGNWEKDAPSQLFTQIVNADPRIALTCSRTSTKTLNNRKLYSKFDPSIVKVDIEVDMVLPEQSLAPSTLKRDFIVNWCTQKRISDESIPWLQTYGSFSPWISYQREQTDFDKAKFTGNIQFGSFLNFNEFIPHGTFVGDIFLTRTGTTLLIEHDCNSDIYAFEIQLRCVNKIISCVTEDAIKLYFWLEFLPKTFHLPRRREKIRVLTAPSIDSFVVAKSNVMAIDMPKSVGLNFLQTLYHPPISNDIYFSPVKTSESSAYEGKLTTFCSTKDSFFLKYKWHCLLSLGFTMTDKLNAKILKRILEISRENSSVIEDLCHVFDGKKKIFDVDSYIDRWVERKNGSSNQLRQDKRLANEDLVRQVVLTPGRTIFKPPEPDGRNRVFSKPGINGASREWAISVAIRDEDMGKMEFRRQEKSIVDSFISRFRDGIQIEDRTYRFLGCSSSQLSKSRSFWFYAGDTERIRSSLGDFSAIKVPAKLLARQGLFFTECRWFLSPQDHRIKIFQEEDIKGGTAPNGERYVFSDGVGKISTDVCQLIWKKCRLRTKNPPCAYQFRMAGYKGMLVHDPTLPARTIVLRDSQIKFPSDHKTLGILKYSQPTPVYLNQPLIAILDQLRKSQRIQNPEFIFYALLQETLLTSLSALLDEQSAASWLGANLGDFSIPFKLLIENGFSLISDPFCKSVLISLYHQQLDLVKKRSRLGISPELGRNAFGVLDETGTLKPQQIFFQYSQEISRDENSRRIILTGQVLITKNPCMQLGDVRLFEAVDAPDLHHLTDVVVFPQQGSRPHPDEMAGSDLDGDEFTLIWDPDLMIKENVAPMDFPPGTANIVPETPSVDDMISFIEEYLLSDNVGRIANAHLALSDQHRDGLSNPVCKSLAQKYAVAVDFQKSGVPALMDSNDRPEKWPDFMEKTERSSYQSESILGKLYRKAREVKDFGLKRFDSTLPDERILELFRRFEREQPRNAEFILSATIKSRVRYNYQMNSISGKYNLNLTESEIFAGIPPDVEYLDKEDTYQAKRLIKKNLLRLWEETTDDFTRQVKKQRKYLAPLSEDEISRIVASAWYKSVYDKDSSSRCYSFPWAAQFSGSKAWPILSIVSENRPVMIQITSPFSYIEISLGKRIVSSESPFQKELNKFNADAKFYLERSVELQKLYAFICERCDFRPFEFSGIAIVTIKKMVSNGYLESQPEISQRERKDQAFLTRLFRPLKPLHIEDGLIGRACLLVLKLFASKNIRRELLKLPGGQNEHNLTKLHQNSFIAFQQIAFQFI